ncbi:uncharacterized protein CELE_T26H8.5 [Caenorhabditis elegans]|uniref:Uncharacterized protein n=1 Tax=Caenorhabditis elegans TaxID=6239 RepID=B1Q278_CAEEL|nr:Uncharacterized protein CELE_T26H8.5 [Caenorhabditis elegans]CAQ16157.1 Uncharacterized protein CELE_T26H8.5 [Caenorhabditis elegans]|eukprot:NP_001123024.1 Uncharacterized protein CELE_T26H8.5 [Caenorhabditis elegans]
MESTDLPLSDQLKNRGDYLDLLIKYYDNLSQKVEFIISVIGIFLCIFHFIFLTQKSIPIFGILIGICLCNFSKFFLIFRRAFLKLFEEDLFEKNEEFCYGFDSFIGTVISCVLDYLMDTLSTLKSGFMLVLGGVQLIFVKYPHGSWTISFSKSTVILQMSIFVAIVSSVAHFISFLFEKTITSMSENSDCIGVSNISSIDRSEQFMISNTDEYGRVNQIISIARTAKFFIVCAYILLIAFLARSWMVKETGRSESTPTLLILVLILLHFLVDGPMTLFGYILPFFVNYTNYTGPQLE